MAQLTAALVATAEEWCYQQQDKRDLNIVRCCGGVMISVWAKSFLPSGLDPHHPHPPPRRSALSDSKDEGCRERQLPMQVFQSRERLLAAALAGPQLTGRSVIYTPVIIRCSASNFL